MGSAWLGLGGAGPHCGKGYRGRGPLPPIYLPCSRPGSLSSGPCRPLQSSTPSQVQGLSLLEETPKARLPLPRKPPCSTPAPQPTDHGGWSLQVRKVRSLPARRWRSSGRARTHSSQIPDLAPGRGAWPSPVACQEQAWPRVGQWREALNGQPGVGTPGPRVGTPFLKGPGTGSHTHFVFCLVSPHLRTGTTWPGRGQGIPAEGFSQAAAHKEGPSPVCWH